MAVGTVADALLVHYGCVPVLRLRHSVLELRVTRSGGRVPGEFQISHFSSASHISTEGHFCYVHCSKSPACLGLARPTRG